MNLESILKNKVLPSMRKTYVTINDFTFPDTYKEIKNEIDNVEINDEDVWICSFPKSGTTWIQEMVWMIINDLDLEKGKEHIEVRSPFLEFAGVADMRHVVEEKPNFDIPFSGYDSVSYLQSLKSPVVIKSHLPFQLLPTQIKSGVKKPKIIYIVREPKDTCVSYYHHAKLFEGFTGTFNEFCDLFLTGQYTYLPYWKHVLSYWEMRNSSNLMMVSYENMKLDLKTVVEKVVEFLEHPFSSENIELLTTHLSFDSMKSNCSVNREWVTKVFKDNKLTNSEGIFMRSGSTGDYKNYMSEEYIKKFDEWTRMHTEGIGYLL